MIRYRGKFHRFVDPWRRPRQLLATATSPVASLADKFRVARLRRRVSKLSVTQLQARPEKSTMEQLRGEGFSEGIIERFFRPFLGGVFLEPDLATSSRKFEFVFRMFAEGDAALPAKGMQAIPRQIAAALPEGTIRTNSPVDAVQRHEVVLASGEQVSGKAVIVATEAPIAAKLLGESHQTASSSVTCLYFAAQRPPLQEPILVLNGEGSGPINNLCVLSHVAPSYAPQQQALISVSVLDHVDTDEQQLIVAVRQQLADWFNGESDAWQHLRTYLVPYALPIQTRLDPVEKPVSRSDGVFVCGDYLDLASIHGAMAAGRRAAESAIRAAVIGDF